VNYLYIISCVLSLSSFSIKRTLHGLWYGLRPETGWELTALPVPGTWGREEEVRGWNGSKGKEEKEIEKKKGRVRGGAAVNTS